MSSSAARAWRFAAGAGLCRTLGIRIHVHPRLVIFVAALAMTACASSTNMHSEDSFGSITYRGEVITLAKVYADFHDYRDDPENLPASVLPKVARLVRTAPFPASFATRKEADDAAFKLMFPGYGLSMLQLHESVALYSVEVPGMGEDRWLVLKQAGQAWVLIDEFLWPQSAGYIQSATLENGRALYKDRDGKVLRERPRADA